MRRFVEQMAKTNLPVIINVSDILVSDLIKYPLNSTKKAILLHAKTLAKDQPFIIVGNNTVLDEICPNVFNVVHQ